MSGPASGVGVVAWWQGLARSARERDIRRQLRYDRSRRTVLRTYLEGGWRKRVPALLPEYMEKLLGAIIAFALIAWLPARFLRVPSVYTLAAFGLLYSLQGGYYSYRLARDPTYRIRKCKCAAAARDASETVLSSRQSRLFGIPNAAIGIAFYPLVLLLVRAGWITSATTLAAMAVVLGAYLGFVMVMRLRALCTTCLNLAALNLLILWQLLR